MPSKAACAVVLGLVLPGAVHAEPADCATLTATLGALDGYSLTVPPAGAADGWCVLDGARLRATGQGPDISAETLRMRGEMAEGEMVSVEIDLKGLRVSPALNDRTMDPQLRAMLRLQSGDLHLIAERNEAEDRLELRAGALRLSGGTELTLAADIAGADLSPASLLTGSLTRLDLIWRSDGRLLRPALEAAGERLTEGEPGSNPVDAARAALHDLLDAMPAGAFVGDSRQELASLIPALPQGRGKLGLVLVSPDGIGAAQVAILVLADDLFDPAALERFFAGTELSADWQPGLVP